ncbi:hypothetical protein F991_00242 [Acinetobacter sp. CIP-A165]|nr:hypothetical protein F991_00242 [Acinetobacter sp. CIP-A165]ENW96928.1 hypothetical protein F903_00741 [Acinetobacter sp. NIPH 298]MDR7017490.1 hypothetical protein [Prolinoborus sp. 3657]
MPLRLLLVIILICLYTWAKGFMVKSGAFISIKSQANSDDYQSKSLSR